MAGKRPHRTPGTGRTPGIGRSSSAPAGHPGPIDMLKQAERAMVVGDHGSAEELFARAIGLLEQLAPPPAALQTARCRFAMALMEQSRWDEAMAHLERVIAVLPGDPRARLSMAHARKSVGDGAGALAELDALLDRAPGFEPALAQRATLLVHAGRGDEALAELSAAIDRGAHGPDIALAFAAVAVRAGQIERGIALLDGALRDDRLPPAVARPLMFAAGRLHDASGAYDAAWEAYSRANELAKPEFDPITAAARVDMLINDWSVDRVVAMCMPVLRSLPDAGVAAPAGAGAAFIVGMPRSGTTLVERLLEPIPGVVAGGELNALTRALREIPGFDARAAQDGRVLPRVERVRGAALARARSAYLAAMDAVPSGTGSEAGSKGARVVTNKTPGNAMMLGVLPALLPGCRVICCERDARDLALSCYFRNFHVGHPFSRDLRWIGSAINAHRRVIAHWMGVFDAIDDQAGGSCIRRAIVSYEALAHDPVAGVPALCEAVGLPGGAAQGPGQIGSVPIGSDRLAVTLEPDQAERGVYTSSVGRWRHYERHLSPLMEVLDHPGTP